MSTLPQTAGQVTQNLSALVYHRKILARDEGLSDQMSALDAHIFRELLLAAGLPTDAGVEMLSLLLAVGHGDLVISASDRDLVDFVLPSSGKSFNAKMQHLRYTRRKLRDALDAIDEKGQRASYPVIEIQSGHGVIVGGQKDGVPTRYKLPILALRRQVLRDLPDNPNDEDIRGAAKEAIRATYGGVARKNDAGKRKLKDVSARQSARTGIAHLRKVVSAKDGAQQIAAALDETPALRLVLSKALGEPPPPVKTTNLPFQQLKAAFDVFLNYAIEHLPEGESLNATARIAIDLQTIEQELAPPEVLSLQHAAEVVNFDVSGNEIAQESTLEQPSDPLLEGSGVVTTTEDQPLIQPPSCGPSSVESQEMTREEIEELSPLSQAGESLAVYESAGYSHVFLRLGDKRTLKDEILPMRAAYEVLPDLLAASDRRKASVMFRAMSGAMSYDKMTPAEQVADDAIVRPRSVAGDDIKGIEGFEPLRPWGSLGFETSLGSFQMVFFVMADAKTAKDIKRRFDKKQGTDKAASDSHRIPGSRNWKPGRDGCPIHLRHLAYNRVWEVAQFEASGLLAPPEPPSLDLPSSPSPVTRYQGPWRDKPATDKQLSLLRKHNVHCEHTMTRGEASDLIESIERQFPSYEIEIARAPRKADGKTPDYSSADQSFANICRMRGFTQAAIEDRLSQERSSIDDKPKRNPAYIERTVRKAFNSARV